MQPREWVVLAVLILVPLAIAVVVTLWSIKQMAYAPKKPSRPKPVLSAADLAALVRPETGEDFNPSAADAQGSGAAAAERGGRDAETRSEPEPPPRRQAPGRRGRSV